MSKKRVSKKTFTNVTLEQAQEAGQQFAAVTNKLAKVEAKMNEEINRVKSKYQDQITDLSEELEEPKMVLETYAKEQKDNWKKKSLELLHCVIGFRTGNPKVDKKKGFTWDAILQLMKKFPQFKAFIRTTEEIDKESILAEKDETTLKDLKELVFVEIVQDEKFYIEPKVEEVALA